MQEITIDDVKQLSLELWLAQRENAQLREELARVQAAQGAVTPQP